MTQEWIRAANVTDKINDSGRCCYFDLILFHSMIVFIRAKKTH